MNNSQKKWDKEMEYPEAPSGYVMLYNYKEPFMKFEGGHGFEGVLLMDGEKDKIQCHFCGEWFESLAPHLKKEYNMTVHEYKKRVGLSPRTALISEKFRQKLIENGQALAKRMKNLKFRPKRVAEKTKIKIRETLKEWRREQQNSYGTCPEQLISQLRQKYEELGRTPTQDEFSRYQILGKTIGFKRACELAGIPYRPSYIGLDGKPVGYKARIQADSIIILIRDFLNKEGRLPRPIEINKSWRGTKLAVFERNGGWKSLCKRAVLSNERFIRISRLQYTTEDLVDLLVTFNKKNGRNPSTSDCKRGLLPHASRFLYRFGSWGKALKAAGL